MKFAIGAVLVYGTLAVVIAAAVHFMGATAVLEGFGSSVVFSLLIVSGLYLMSKDS